jgi:HlyD family secretion protein
MILTGLIAASLVTGARATEPSSLPTVTVIAARTGTLTEHLTLTGSFVARDEAMVTPQVDGLAVTEIDAEEGDMVVAGQVLGRLASDAVRASIAENAANVARAQASMAQAAGQIAEAAANKVQAAAALGRATDLVSRGDLSHETFDQRRASADVSTARLEAANEQLALARADLALATAQRQALDVTLERTVLRAPVAGRISRRMARLGAVVGTASEPLFRIITDDTVEMEADVPEALLGRLTPGQPAEVAASGATIPGRVRLVSPEVNATTRLGRVRIALQGPLRPAIGAFARANVNVARRSGVLVPLSAVLFAPDGPVVEVVVRQAGDDARISARHVVIGLVGEDRVEIDRGIGAGDAVVAVSGTFLRDGDWVVTVGDGG